MKKKSLKSAKHRRTPKKYIALLILVFAVTASIAALSVFAAIIPPDQGGGPAVEPTTQPNGAPVSPNTGSGGSNSSSSSSSSSSGGTTQQSTQVDRNQTTPCSGSETNLANNCIIKDIQQLVDFLSAGVAIIVVAVIIVGGIQYITAGNSPDATVKARQRMTNGIIALVAFMLVWAFLQWLIPGGVFG